MEHKEINITDKYIEKIEVITSEKKTEILKV